MLSATITSKGQITIPIDIRKSLELKAGDKLKFVMDGEKVMFWAVTKNISSLKGMIKKPETLVSLEDMKTSIKNCCFDL